MSEELLQLEEEMYMDLFEEEMLETQLFHEKVKDKLYEGMIIKNYNDLCDILELEKKGGNSKKAQMNELERYFSYDKIGQKIIITGIRDLPLPKTNYRGHNKSVYVQHIEKIILDILKETETIQETKSKLLPMLGMVNEKFTDYSYEQALHDKENFKINDIRNFKDIASGILGCNLYNALKSMDERFLIVFEPKVIFYDAFVYDEKTGHKHLEVFEAKTVKDKDKYAEAVLNALTELNKKHHTTRFKTLGDVFSFRESKTFYPILNSILNENYGWFNVMCYMRISAREQALDIGQEIVNREYEKLQLNGKSVDRMHNALETELQRQCRMIEKEITYNKQNRIGLAVTQEEIEKKKNNLSKTFKTYDNLVEKLIIYDENETTL